MHSWHTPLPDVQGLQTLPRLPFVWSRWWSCGLCKWHAPSTTPQPSRKRGTCSHGDGAGAAGWVSSELALSVPCHLHMFCSMLHDRSVFLQLGVVGVMRCSDVVCHYDMLLRLASGVWEMFSVALRGQGSALRHRAATAPFPVCQMVSACCHCCLHKRSVLAVIAACTDTAEQVIQTQTSTVEKLRSSSLGRCLDWAGGRYVQKEE